MVSSTHPIFLEGMRIILAGDPKIDLVGEARNLSETIGHVIRLRPDVLLFDVPADEGNTIAAIRQMKNAQHNLRILAVSVRGEPDSVTPFRKAGVSQFLSPETRVDELLRMLHSPARDAARQQVRKAAGRHGNKRRIRKSRPPGVAA